MFTLASIAVIQKPGQHPSSTTGRYPRSVRPGNTSVGPTFANANSIVMNLMAIGSRMIYYLGIPPHLTILIDSGVSFKSIF
jgi:hypothetical protein